MPARRKKKKKVSDKEKGEQLVARFNEIRAIPLPENATAFPKADIPNICHPSTPGNEGFHHSVQMVVIQTATGTINGYWISFMTGKGVAAGMRFPPNVSPKQIGAAIWFGMTDGFRMPWDELNQGTIPDAIKKNKNANAVDGDDQQQQQQEENKEEAKDNNDEEEEEDDDGFEFHIPDSGFSKELKKANAKEMTIYFLNNQKDFLMRSWACRTNDSLNVFPEDDDVIKVTTTGKPDDYDDKPEVEGPGQAAMRQVRLALSRQESAIHPDPKYKGERAKWAC